MNSWTQAADLLAPPPCRDCGGRHFSTVRDWLLTGPQELDALLAAASACPEAWPVCTCTCCPPEALNEAIEALEQRTATK